MFTFIEVFAGCGGLSTGLTDAGWRPLLLVDNDAKCIETLKLNKSDTGAVILKEDATKLDLNGFRGQVNLLAGGVPCQAFSQAGLRKGTTDPRGALFNDFARFVRECEPDMFLVENVVGLTTHAKGKTFTDVVNLIAGDAYHVYHSILNAHDYGVAQKRKRIFIVGIRRVAFPDGIPFEFPPPLVEKPCLRDALADCPKSDGVVYPVEKKKVLDLVPPGGCWVDLPEAVQRSYMGASFESGGGRRGIARRISWDEPSLTLTTSPCQKQTERCHPDETRPFTVREYARIQTFPDEYIFSGSVMSQYKQIGNAVPVQLAYYVAKQLRRYCERHLREHMSEEKEISTIA